MSWHFDYHVNLVSDKDIVKLNLLTYNPKHEEYMLLHSASGSSSVACLYKMLDYLKLNHRTNTDYTFTIKWHKKYEIETHISYFVANNEEEAKRKFLYEKDPNDYDFAIEMNPLS